MRDGAVACRVGPESKRGFTMMKKLLTASVCAAALLTAPALTGTSLITKAYAADPAETSATDALDGYLASGMELDAALAQLVNDGYAAGDVVSAANGLADSNPDLVASIGAALASLADQLGSSDDPDTQSYAAALDASVTGTQLADAYSQTRGTTASLNNTGGNNTGVSTGSSENDNTGTTGTTNDSTPETPASPS